MFLDWKDVELSHVIDLLRLLQALYSDEENWIDWPIAVDSNGLEVLPDDPTAIKWCMIGATEKLAALNHEKPLCDFVAVATREYLNDMSDDKLIKGSTSYEDEITLIQLALEDLTK